MKNSKESYYNIVTKCALKNVPDVIGKIMNILKNYKITANDIKYAKNKIMTEYEYSKFYSISSYNGFYKNFLLFDKKFRTNKDVFDAINNITDKEIFDYYEKFKNKIIKSSIIFYYSHKNINNKINNKLLII
jgi:hypothetical protein